MKKIGLALGATLALTTASWAQEKNIHDAVFEYRESLQKVQGVIDVTVGGLNGEKRIVVRVESDEAKDTVNKLIGNRLEGFPVQVIVTPRSKPKPVELPKEDAPPRDESTPPAEPKSSVGQTVAEPSLPRPPGATPEGRPDLRDPMEECDIMRELLGLPPRKEGRTGRCCIVRRITIGSPGAVARVVTKFVGDAVGSALLGSSGNGSTQQQGGTTQQGGGFSQGGTGQPNQPGSPSANQTGQFSSFKQEADAARKASLEKNSFKPPEGTHSGAGVGSVFGTDVVKHRRDCPIFLRELIEQVMKATPK